MINHAHVRERLMRAMHEMELVGFRPKVLQAPKEVVDALVEQCAAHCHVDIVDLNKLRVGKTIRFMGVTIEEST